ncbi:nucleotide sugar dehydrogenase [Aeromicrobium fastidiosum]|uniref:nucleotide sugar dehydrogenase n=1 Tax=Aeromicrobium TaxID=2040 RepID=UPI001780A196|nr:MULTISPECIES: nucleotide sugar dehydrogenase [Aeromicrobium]MBD8606387.1 nucleotide sugar dehydrogenase [Aeromicrobium sp. CFBP 8757]MCL8250467.1 nucleotide sugar dehydrogenase [Aeromicrobium fastidiosum]
MSRVIVVGLGYVGLPLALRAAEVGHEVVGIDLDPRKIELLCAGVTYIEDATDHRIRSATASGRFTARLGWDPDGADEHVEVPFDVAVIAVPTPLTQHVPDLSYVASAGRMIGRMLRRDAAVVLESTTYPGTTEGLLAEVLMESSGLRPGVDFHLGFSPERIDPGSPQHTLENTPKLVSATTPEGLLVIDRFYGTIVERTVPVSSPRIAEMAKVFENTQAYVNIGLVNELSEICHDMGIDIHEMLDAAMTKGHSMAYWVPGPGVGGHCLPIDPMYLAWQTRTALGRRFRFAELADDINTSRPDYVVRRASQVLRDRPGGLRGASVLVLGLAYKPGVGDLRESPAVDVVEALLRERAAVTTCDPHVQGWTRTSALELEELPGAVESFDLVVIATHHAEFDYEKIALKARLVLDCRHAMEPSPHVVAL